MSQYTLAFDIPGGLKGLYWMGFAAGRRLVGDMMGNM